MCRISEEIWREGEARGEARGRQEGRKEGIKEGRKEGRKEGKLEGKAELIRMFMEEHGLSFSQVCDTFGLSREERSAIEKLIQV